MVLDHTITHFVTNFEAVRRRGARTEVLVWIRDKDDISCSRMRDRIRDELRPLVGDVTVIVEPDPWIPTDKGRGLW
jgi:hypothetical protein